MKPRRDNAAYKHFTDMTILAFLFSSFPVTTLAKAAVVTVEAAVAPVAMVEVAVAAAAAAAMVVATAVAVAATG